MYTFSSVNTLNIHIADWGEFGHSRDFCNFWTAFKPFLWAGYLKTYNLFEQCPAENVDLRSMWECQEFFKNLLFFWPLRNF